MAAAVVWVVMRDRAATPPELDEPSEALLERLEIAPAGSDAGYDRELFPHWSDQDGDGCDTRCEVLEAERRTDLPNLPQGGWLSVYDGVATADEADLEVDHVVALAEAWRSGAADWDAARRERFANDLADPDALIAVTTDSNQSKGDDDPTRWQPPDRNARCSFARAWVETKVRWGLTADQVELDALHQLLAAC